MFIVIRERKTDSKMGIERERKRRQRDRQTERQRQRDTETREASEIKR
jgi:hypothetical protein